MDLLARSGELATNFINEGGYLGLLALMFVDSVNVPIPSELILGFTGYLVSTGRFNFALAVGVATLGFTAGAAVSYWIGYKGGRPFVNRFGKYFLISQRDLVRADRLFAKYGMAIAFFSRMIPLLRSFISIPAGITKVRFWPYLGYSMLGSLVWSIVLVYAGTVIGENYARIADALDGYEYVVVALIGLAIVVWIARFIWEQVAIRRELRAAGNGASGSVGGASAGDKSNRNG